MQAQNTDIESDTTSLSSNAKNIKEWDQDLFPICQELITLIRTIDGLNVTTTYDIFRKKNLLSLRRCLYK
jgi:hypothetical protein